MKSLHPQFQKRFCADPWEYLGRFDLQKLRQLGEILELKFYPPFAKDEDPEFEKDQIIKALAGDFEGEQKEQILIAAINSLEEKGDF